MFQLAQPSSPWPPVAHAPGKPRHEGAPVEKPVMVERTLDTLFQSSPFLSGSVTTGKSCHCSPGVGATPPQ